MQPGFHDERGLTVREQLRHVYWIGGGSGSGKSTIARRIAEQHGLHLYATDEAMPEHARRSTPTESPYLCRFIAMDMDERWVTRTPQAMLETFHWFQGEGFGMIVDDLLQLPTDRGVIVEGFRLLPHLVKPLLADPGRAVWLLPTSEFRRAVFDRRGGATWGFIAKTGNPEQALRNLLERDGMFTARLAEETRRLDLSSIAVDLTMAEGELARRVAEAFRL